MRLQSIWVYKGHLALGKVFAAGPYKRLMVRDAASSKLCGPCAPPKSPKRVSQGIQRFFCMA